MQSNALARINNMQVSSMDDLRTLGEVFAKSGFFKDAQDVSKAIVKIIAGSELGFGAVASMTGIYIVKERVTLSANLIGAAIKRSGRYNYRVIQHTDEVCEIEFFEHGQSIGKSSFTIEDAKRAELTANATWKKFPRNMLFARALSNGAKWHTADVFGGPVYTPDELGAQVTMTEDGDITVIEEPAPASNLRALPAPQPAIVETLPDRECNLFRDLAIKKGIHIDQWLAEKGKPKLEQIPLDDAKKLHEWLKAKPDANASAEPTQPQQPLTATQQRIEFFWLELAKENALFTPENRLLHFNQYLTTNDIEFNNEVSGVADIPDAIGDGYAKLLANMLDAQQARKDDPLI